MDIRALVSRMELEGADRYKGGEVGVAFVIGIEDRCEFGELVLVLGWNIEGAIKRD